MASITSLGIGSGLDINSMVDQLVALESRPLTAMRSSASRLQTQVSAYGRMQSLFSSLQDASNALTASALWQRSLASSSNDAAVSAVGGSGATPGNYSVQVNKLAQSQTLASGSVFGAGTDLVGAGTLRIELGGWNSGQTAFSAKAGATAVDITVTDTDTVATLRDKINAAGAGVTASLVTDASGVRLALRSDNSGTDNGFRISAADNDGNPVDSAGLSRLAFDPPAGATAMEYKQAAGNAEATVNGIDVVSASNELTGVVEGLTLRLKQQTSSAVDVTVSNDTSAVAAAVKTFADAYNELSRYIADQTKYDAGSKVSGPLQGDSAANSLMSRLRSVLNAPSAASAAFPRLSDVGLSLQRDGTLAINQTKLDKALTQLPELKKAFGNSDSLVPENNGFARRYSTLATQVLGVDGSLTTRSDGLRRAITQNGTAQEKLADRVENFRARLVAQYSAMDANLSRLNALSSYVTQQLAQLNKSNNN